MKTKGNELVSDGLMTITEAVRFLGVCRTTLYELMNEGELAHVKIRDRRLIPRRALLQLAEKNLVGAAC